MKIAITGSTGLVGSRIVDLLEKDFTFIPLNHDRVDLTDQESVKQAFTNLDFDLLLHCAGYTHVDKAEHEKELAHALNVSATEYLVEEVKKKQKKMIYISTDFVFDGTEDSYDEDSTPHPIAYYGLSKYEGEKAVQGTGMIVRIAYPFRAEYDKRTDFFRTIKSLLEKGVTIAGVKDTTVTPTFIDDIAYGLKHLMTHYSPEVYHLVGAESLTPYNAFLVIADVFNLKKDLISETTYEKFFDNKAKRPKKGNITSRKNSFYPMKGFKDALIAIRDSIK